MLACGAYSVKTDKRHSNSQVNTNRKCLNTAEMGITSKLQLQPCQPVFG